MRQNECKNRGNKYEEKQGGGKRVVGWVEEVVEGGGRNTERIFNNAKSRDSKETHDTRLTAFPRPFDFFGGQKKKKKQHS